MSESWCLIESDPGVFTEMIQSLGVQGLQVEEIYSLEDKSLYESLLPIYGLIFLFKFDSELYKSDTRAPISAELVPNVFYSKQIVQNACATQAILHVLLNLPSQIVIGELLLNLKQLMSAMDSRTRGETIGQNNEIRNIHNSYCASDPFLLMDHDDDDDKSGDAYHFISYLPVDGKIYELDGMRGNPIIVGEYDATTDWIEVAKTEVTRRMNEYSHSENGFTLLGIVDNIKEKCVQQLKTEIEFTAVLENYNVTNILPTGYDIKDIGENDSDRAKILNEHENLIIELNSRIETEDEKMNKYKKENERRKHNYIPLVMELLKIMGEKDVLLPNYEVAEKKRKDYITEKQKQNAK